MRLKIKWIATMIFACVIMFSLAFADNGGSVWAAGKTETLENQSVKVTKVKLNKKNLTINIAGSAKLTAALSPTKAKNRKVTWKSSNKKVATVKNGKVTGISSGTAVITASAGGKKASCKVKVNDAVVSNTVYKMLKGKWDQDGMQGLVYCIIDI